LYLVSSVTLALANVGALKNGIKDAICASKYSSRMDFVSFMLQQSIGSVVLVSVNLKEKPIWYTREVNTAGKVPTLMIFSQKKNINGVEESKEEVLIESGPITRYIMAHNSDSLTPLDECRANIFLETFNTFHPDYYSLMKAPESQAAKDKLTETLRRISAALDSIPNRQENATKSTTTSWIMGQKFSFADAFCSSFLQRIKGTSFFFFFYTLNNKYSFSNTT
jgi:glutathione S-transferase